MMTISPPFLASREFPFHEFQDPPDRNDCQVLEGQVHATSFFHCVELGIQVCSFWNKNVSIPIFR